MPSRRLLLLIVAGLLGACAARPTWVRLPPPAERPEAMVIRDVRLFAGDAASAADGRWDVWVRGDRIVRVAPAGEVRPASGVLEVDGAGGTLLPGLIDGHVHVGSTDGVPWALRLPDPRANLQRFLRSGLTTVVDVGGELSLMADVRKGLADGTLVGPDVVFAGFPLAHRDGHPAAMVRAIVPWPFKGMAARRMGRHVADVTDVVAAIDELRRGGVSFVKLMVDSIPLTVPQLDDAMLRAVVAGAHAADLPVLAHVGGNDDALRALRAGVDVLVHNVYREPISSAVVAELLQRQVPVVVTIGIWDAVDDVAGQGPPPLPFEDLLTDERWRREVRDRPEGWNLRGFEEWLAMIAATRDVRSANAAVLREAGVAVLVGSDAPNVGWPAGAGLHVEMRKMVAAGFAPGEVLRAATSGNAAAFGLSDRGIVAEGRRADLLLVDGDPTADIGDLEKLRLVIRAGVPVEFIPPR